MLQNCHDLRTPGGEETNSVLLKRTSSPNSLKLADQRLGFGNSFSRLMKLRHEKQTFVKNRKNQRKTEHVGTRKTEFSCPLSTSLADRADTLHQRDALCAKNRLLVPGWNRHRTQNLHWGISGMFSMKRALIDFFTRLTRVVSRSDLLMELANRAPRTG